MMRRLFALTAIGLGLLSTGLPALARAPRPELEWKAFRDTAGQEMPDDHLHGDVRLRGRISSPNGVEAWKVEVAPVEGASYPGFGTICEGAMQGGGDTVDIDCDWETATDGDGMPSTNDSYRLRVSVRSDGDEFRLGPDKVVVLANPASEPRSVRLDYDKADRRVSLSWSANPEPDVAHYVVEERLGSKPWKTVGEPVDTSWGQVMTEPGSYRYQVSAVRRVGDKGQTRPGPSNRPEGKVTVTRTPPAAPAQPAGPTDAPSRTEEPPVKAAREAAPEAGVRRAPDGPAPAEPAARSSRRPSTDLLRGTTAPDLRQPPTRRAVRPVPEPAAAAAAESDPGYSLTLPYPKRQVTQPAPEPTLARLQPAASGNRPAARPRSNLPLAMAVLAASFLGLMSGLLHLGRSSVASRKRLPAPSEAGAPADGLAEAARVSPLEERLWWLGVQWRHADTATRLELMGEVLDIQLELVSALGRADNGGFGNTFILSAAEK
jgi:hypothetical protein